METTICSHTLVKDGMPFIEPVLRQVEPFMSRMLITVSEKSTDGTLDVLRRLEREFPRKIRIDFENVNSVAQLTGERQKQIDKTHEDWVLFLDDDDWWPTESLKETTTLLDKDVDGYGISPYQIIDENYYNAYYLEKKFFTKWFKNKDIHYRQPWPRDIIYTGDRIIYWKKNDRVPRLTGKYFHLSGIKDNSFRNENWATYYKKDNIRPKEYPEDIKRHVWKIFSWKSTH